MSNRKLLHFLSFSIYHWPFSQLLYSQMMMMMINCFCGMVDRRKAFSLIFSRGHCQRSSPSRISDTPRAGSEPAQNLSSGFVEWNCAIVITTTPRRHYVNLTNANLQFEKMAHFLQLPVYLKAKEWLTITPFSLHFSLHELKTGTIEMANLGFISLQRVKYNEKIIFTKRKPVTL